MKRRDIIDRCFDRLRGYCLKQFNCNYCRFNNNGECALSDNGVPAVWEMPTNEQED